MNSDCLSNNCLGGKCQEPPECYNKVQPAGALPRVPALSQHQLGVKSRRRLFSLNTHLGVQLAVMKARYLKACNSLFIRKIYIYVYIGLQLVVLATVSTLAGCHSSLGAYQARHKCSSGWELCCCTAGWEWETHSMFVLLQVKDRRETDVDW